MSAVKVVWYLLSTNATLTATVPVARIQSGPLPLNTTLPAISIEEVSALDRRTVSMLTSDVLISSRVQVMVHAKTYPQKKGILELVRKALPNTSGTVNGVDVDSILPDATSPDLDDIAAGIYEQAKDFFVRYRVSRV